MYVDKRKWQLCGAAAVVTQRGGCRGDTTPFNCSREPCAIVMLLDRKHSTCIHPIRHTCCMHTQTNNSDTTSNLFPTNLPVKTWPTFLRTSVSRWSKQYLSTSFEFDTLVSGGGWFIYDHPLCRPHKLTLTECSHRGGNRPSILAAWVCLRFCFEIKGFSHSSGPGVRGHRVHHAASCVQV